MENANSAANALTQKQNQQHNNSDKNQPEKIVNEQEQGQITNNDDIETDDKDKQYDKENKDRSWKGGKEEEIGPDKPDEETDDSDETEKKTPKMSM